MQITLSSVSRQSIPNVQSEAILLWSAVATFEMIATISPAAVEETCHSQSWHQMPPPPQELTQTPKQPNTKPT